MGMQRLLSWLEGSMGRSGMCRVGRVLGAAARLLVMCVPVSAVTYL